MNKIPNFLSKENGNGLLTSCDLFLREWFVTLFSGLFSIEGTLKLWDEILKQGDYYIVKITLALFECINNKSQDVADYDELNQRLYNIEDHVTEEELLACMEKLNFDKREYIQNKLEI